MPRHRRSVIIPGYKGFHKAALLGLLLGIFFISWPVWAQEEEEKIFKGVGIHLRLKGAWTMFSGGDLEKGTAGRYERIVGDLVGSGLIVTEQEKKSFTSGVEVGGDLVYYFTPRIGVGLGGSWMRSRPQSSALFHVPGGFEDYKMTSHPEIKVISLRLGLFLAVPLSRIFTFCASAGPAWHFAEFNYNSTVIIPGPINSLHQDGKTDHWGLHGCLGLEVRMNERLAFILEAQGRYARIPGFEGREVTYRLESGQEVEVRENGILYFIEGEAYPRLDIIQGQPAGDLQAKEAAFSYSGVSFMAGLNFKF